MLASALLWTLAPISRAQDVIYVTDLAVYTDLVCYCIDALDTVTRDTDHLQGSMRRIRSLPEYRATNPQQELPRRRAGPAIMHLQFPIRGCLVRDVGHRQHSMRLLRDG